MSPGSPPRRAALELRSPQPELAILEAVVAQQAGEFVAEEGEILRDQNSHRTAVFQWAALHCAARAVMFGFIVLQSRSSPSSRLPFGGRRRAAWISVFSRRRANSPLEHLTPRVRDVLGLMAEGHSNAGIADALVRSLGAVEKHIASIFTKLRLPPSGSDHRRVPAVLAYLQQE